MELPDADLLVDEQIAYYRARAPEYDDWWLRTGRYEADDAFGRRWDAEKRALHDAVLEFHPGGDVLELAAGTGNLTRQLTAVADHVTAVDSSSEALAIARGKLEDSSNVSFVAADLFAWRPPRRFDAVVFGFWLSHVPSGRARQFWQLVDDALRPGGRVFFTDNAMPVEQAASKAGRSPITAGGKPTPWSQTWIESDVSARELADGRRFCVVKRTWTPRRLETELAAMGWQGTVHQTGEFFIHGTAVRAQMR